LVAAASFLIVSVSAFRLAPSDAGTGGFALMATSDRPIHYDLNTPEGRLELGFSDEAERELQNWHIYSFRIAAGEDASCLSLYRPTQPRVLGVPIDFVERGGFEWAAAADVESRVVPDPGRGGGPPGSLSKWQLLNEKLKRDEGGRPIVPVVLDASTSTYSLHLAGLGARFTIRDAADAPVTLQVVGLLKNSVLQGNVLMSEANFLRLFPDTGGYRFFLLEALAQSPAGPPRGPVPGERGSPAASESGEKSVATILESTLADDGFDVVDARERLAAYLAVQNTYLSTFQSLGALGLLLGTIGLAVVQLRSVLERRGELALMRAGGFPRRRLMLMVLFENAVLLLGGLAIGCIAAGMALIPQWAPQSARVPWAALAALLCVIAVVGLIAGWLATRSALRAPIVPALRGD
jgi:putative ABC transport system permease protein